MALPVLTYGLLWPVEITRLCASRCHFCPFPFTARAPLPARSDFEQEIRAASRAGATFLDFTSGEGLDVFPEVRSAWQRRKRRSYLDYLQHAAHLAYRTPRGRAAQQVRLDVGPLSAASWKMARRHFLCARLLLTGVDPALRETGALRDAHTQDPMSRLQSIIDAGKAGMPLTTGLMVGIGETPASRRRALSALAHVASEYGHVQSCLVQAFRPHPATPMAAFKPTPLAAMLETVSAAREIMPPSVRIQINALDWRRNLPELVQAGAEDLGDLNLRVLERGGADPEMELALMFEPLKAGGRRLRKRRALLRAAENPADFSLALRPLLSAPADT